MLKKTKTFLQMIKFEHSIFALPFAYLGMILAKAGLPSLKTFVAITAAMVAARTFGMSINRLIDKNIDAKNPRTKGRALPQGELSSQFVVGIIILSLLFFIIAIYLLPPLCWLLSPIALVAMLVYPYLKRFTWMSHLFLGLILAMAPIGGWIAVTGSFNLVPLLLALGVALWVAGFDVIYAVQDYHFDKKNNLFSIPVKWGRARALKISRLFHVITIICFALVLILSPVRFWAWASFAVIAAIIIREHRVLVGGNLSQIQKAFFVSNAWVSMIFFLGILLDFLA